jgi:hypothetical protein
MVPKASDLFRSMVQLIDVTHSPTTTISGALSVESDMLSLQRN